MCVCVRARVCVCARACACACDVCAGIAKQYSRNGQIKGFVLWNFKVKRKKLSIDVYLLL